MQEKFLVSMLGHLPIEATILLIRANLPEGTINQQERALIQLFNTGVTHTYGSFDEVEELALMMRDYRKQINARLDELDEMLEYISENPIVE